MVSIIEDNARKLAKDYLNNHGIKQAYVANKMGISETTLSSRLNGRLKFDANFAIAFARSLNISPDIFLK